MDNWVWSLSHCTVDGTLFRTRTSQIRKKTKTDNSCLVGEVRVREDENGPARTAKCYGVIKKLLLHFMYPPPKKHTYKLNKRKLEKLDVPWILVAECLWYEHLGKHETTGLVRITPNGHWQEGCSIHNMCNTLPMNVSFWPEVPFAVDHFGEDGKPLRVAMRKGQYDFRTGLTSVLNVIHM